MQDFSKYNKRHTEVIEVITWKTFLLKLQGCVWNGIGQSTSWPSIPAYLNQRSLLGIGKIRFRQYRHWKKSVVVLELLYLNFCLRRWCGISDRKPERTSWLLGCVDGNTTGTFHAVVQEYLMAMRPRKWRIAIFGWNYVLLNIRTSHARRHGRFLPSPRWFTVYH